MQASAQVIKIPDEAKSLGADHFVNLNDKKELAKAADTMDFIMYTSPSHLDADQYLPLLRAGGKLCILGATQTVNASCLGMIAQSKSIVASAVGTPTMIKEMLHFSARHQVQAKIETFALDEVNEAIKKMRANQVRFRPVLIV